MTLNDLLNLFKNLLNALFGSKLNNVQAVSAQPQPQQPVAVPQQPVSNPVPVVVPVATTPGGSVFIQNNMNLVGPVREANILQAFQSGNVPDFLFQFTPVTVTSGANSITYNVTSDVLCLGNNDDYVRMPMNPHTAQAIADQYGCSLITKKMADDIWKAAVNKLDPKPWGPPYDDDMSRTYRIGIHNTTIQNQLAGKDPKALTTGHKKDVVITNHLAPNNPNRRVAIYGWFYTNGAAIQGLNPTSHADTYEDYSHGIRLVSSDCTVNGVAMKLQDVFSHPTYSSLVSDEGPLSFKRY